MNREERRAEARRRRRGHTCGMECPVCGVHSGTWPVSIVGFKDEDAEEAAMQAAREGRTIDVEVISECEIDRVQWLHSALVGAEET